MVVKRGGCMFLKKWGGCQEGGGEKRKGLIHLSALCIVVDKFGIVASKENINFYSLIHEKQ